MATNHLKFWMWKRCQNCWKCMRRWVCWTFCFRGSSYTDTRIVWEDSTGFRNSLPFWLAFLLSLFALAAVSSKLRATVAISNTWSQITPSTPMAFCFCTASGTLLHLDTAGGINNPYSPGSYDGHLANSTFLCKTCSMRHLYFLEVCLASVFLMHQTWCIKKQSNPNSQPCIATEKRV